MCEKDDEIDWMNASRHERKEPSISLYKALRAVADVTGDPIDILMDQAFGEPIKLGTDYISNFRRGNIAAGRAMMIHHWLEQNHFDIARIAAPALFRFNPKSAWELFVEKHAKTDGQRIIPIKREMGILSRTKDTPTTVETLRLGQCFCFELDSPLDGVVVAFERCKDEWHPLPLGADERRLRVLVREGAQLLPRDDVDKPIELEELHDTGQHQYVFVVSSKDAAPINIKDIYRLRSKETFVFATTVQFVT